MLNTIQQIRFKLRTNKLFQNVAALGMLQVLNYALPFITLPHISRRLGPEQFGILGIANSLNMWLLMISDFGFQMSATASVARSRDDKVSLANTFGAISYAKLLLILVSAFFLLIFSTIAYQEYFLLFCINFGFVVGQALFPVWFFQGMEDMRYITGISASTKILFTILVFPLVKGPGDLLLVPALNSLGSILGGIAAQLIVRRKYHIRMPRFSVQVVFSELRHSLTFFLSRISVSIYTSSTALFLGFVSPPLFVGQYTAAEKLYGAIQMTYSPIATALYPHMVRTKDFKSFANIAKIASLVFYPILILCFVFAPIIVRTIYGSEYHEAIVFFRQFSIVAMVVFVSQLMGYPLHGAFNKEKLANKSVILGAVVHILGISLLFLGVIKYKYVIWIILFTESLILMIRVISGKREYKEYCTKMLGI